MTAPSRESALARGRAAALAELRAAPRAVSWRRQAARLVTAQVGLALVGMAVSLVAGLARPGDVLSHLATIVALLAVGCLGAVAALAPRRPRALSAWRMAALAAAPAAMALVVLARGAGLPSTRPEWVCSATHLAVGLVPLACALVGLRQWAWSGTAAFAAGLGAGTTGALLGDVVCERGAAHVLVYHLGAWIVLALACLVISRRLRPRTFAP